MDPKWTWYLDGLAAEAATGHRSESFLGKGNCNQTDCGMISARNFMNNRFVLPLLPACHAEGYSFPKKLPSFSLQEGEVHNLASSSCITGSGIVVRWVLSFCLKVGFPEHLHEMKLPSWSHHAGKLHIYNFCSRRGEMHLCSKAHLLVSPVSWARLVSVWWLNTCTSKNDSASLVPSASCMFCSLVFHLSTVVIRLRSLGELCGRMDENSPF